MKNPVKFHFFPLERLYEDRWYPFAIWALGWMCIIKATFWIFSPRGFHLTIDFPQIVPIKYLVYMIILVVLSQGIFNFRLWARFLVLAVCIIDLYFYLFISGFSPSGFGFTAYLFEYSSGPAGDLIIFYLLHLSWNDFGKAHQYVE